MTTRIMLTNTKRLGRYHQPTNNNNDTSTSQPSFNELASLYEDNAQKPLLDWNKPLFGNKRTSLQKILAKANKTTERATYLAEKYIGWIISSYLSTIFRVQAIRSLCLI
jgi:hypothetical protein